ncbi:nicotinic acid mononucleotide adenylyltransferase [Dietzia alimentaria]|jgi:nicotinate-nucleotide adenylyltransferase|uniref:Probable nicotinate-nucleotide adenylyltransferase n=1 Tax=Dietzia maris TaxID=37915 RepID=A0A365P906_9ACTN|nr:MULTISPECIES: nicotinate-nucleotide adenylyltransferase [Dietzia]MBB0991714.1 nicotinate-nucleotide adenylyltransferase [Dietzia sp. SLG510A3-30A2]ODQ94237.1 nicotinic acid mononucleotide adenylyltransferase [Dietzia alimentaria]MCZ4655671.1 nicotinate-nucleotide adenylyltransferase [Dietzia kunjamensis]MDV3356002.1 nicotinate-nucleotide adenylyltransferase [Dietzia sp. IN118]RBA33853.1 nicotinate-nucleotide adenylyltransferase [Dietzia maris]
MTTTGTTDGARRRIGVMGGTFDPIHHGHLVAASEVAHRFGLDDVVFVPTGEPWQKRGREVSPAEDRYLMTVIATASNPRFSVSRVDIDRDGPTYTLDTLKDLLRQHPDTDLYFITGADALEKILTWRGWEEMFDFATFVGVSRPGFELSDTHLTEIRDGRVYLLEIPALAISSTECRRRAAEDAPVWYLVPDGVVQYIAKRNLYRPEGSTRLDGTLAATAPVHRVPVPTEPHPEENPQ